MPMVKNLEIVHQELMNIARESSRLVCTKYTFDDIEKLQDKLRVIDSQYNEGAFSSEYTDRYEQEGQAQVCDELEKIHKTLHIMLSRIDN